jgi:hypothetical protein
LIYNSVGINVESVSRLKEGKYKEKVKKVKGSIIKLADRVRFKWYVCGKAHIKAWKITKKRSLEDALRMAASFQKEIYS